MTKPLSGWIALALLAVPGTPCLAAGRPADGPANATAYTALRVMGKALGADSLNRVVEVTGRDGMPQPALWRIVVREGDKATREIKISGGRIVSQETVNAPSLLRTIRLQDLNLDSSGAFDATDAQARKTRVRFDSINYSLRVGAGSGKPVWDLELLNQSGAHVGGIRLAAHDGNLLSMNGLIAGESATPTPLAGTPPPAVNPNHDTVRPVRVQPSGPTTRSTTRTTTTTTTVRTSPRPLISAESRPDAPPAPVAPSQRTEEEGGFFTRAGHTLDHTTANVGDGLNRAGQTVDRHARRAGATVQRFFTGHSDLDQENNTPARE